jgi:hypothetical protein
MKVWAASNWMSLTRHLPQVNKQVVSARMRSAFTDREQIIKAGVQVECGDGRGRCMLKVKQYPLAPGSTHTRHGTPLRMRYEGRGKTGWSDRHSTVSWSEPYLFNLTRCFKTGDGESNNYEGSKKENREWIVFDGGSSLVLAVPCLLLFHMVRQAGSAFTLNATALLNQSSLVAQVTSPRLWQPLGSDTILTTVS